MISPSPRKEQTPLGSIKLPYFIPKAAALGKPERAPLGRPEKQLNPDVIAQPD
jgi:hypothetical protein